MSLQSSSNKIKWRNDTHILVLFPVDFIFFFSLFFCIFSFFMFCFLFYITAYVYRCVCVYAPWFRCWILGMSRLFWFISLAVSGIWALASYYDSIIHPDKNGDDDTLSPFRYAHTHTHTPSPSPPLSYSFSSSSSSLLLSSSSSFRFVSNGFTAKNVGHISWPDWMCYSIERESERIK